MKNTFYIFFFPLPQLQNVALSKCSNHCIERRRLNFVMSSTVSYKLRSNVLRNWRLKIFRMLPRPFGMRSQCSGISAFTALTNGKLLCPITMVSCNYTVDCSKSACLLWWYKGLKIAFSLRWFQWGTPELTWCRNSAA